jgi:aminoglycoside phosphotransferase (APT) family kinase protein
MNHDRDFTEAQLVAIAQLLVPDWTDDELFSDWTYLEGGYSNDNYAFLQNAERFVLRIPRGHPTPAAWHKELDWYKRLSTETGLKPIAFSADTGQMITPWVSGTLLVDSWKKDQLHPQPSDSVLSRLSLYLKTLHSQLPSTDNRYSSSMAVGNGSHVTCHNDLNPWNIIVTGEDRWVTLDWEWVGLNDPIFDIISLHQGLGLNGGLLQLCQDYFGPSASIGSNIDSNTGVNTDPNDLSSRLTIGLQAYWRRELTWAENQIASGNDRHEILAQRETATHKLSSLKDIY